MSFEATNPTWSINSEEALLNRASTQLWMPVPMRLVLTASIAQMSHFYYRAQGAYSNPEAKIDSYISLHKADGNRVAIVTGANTGIGYETARALGKAGYKVILACRNQAKAEAAISSLLEEFSSANLKFMELDLASFDSVKKFASEFNKTESHLDLLVNNAGIMVLPTFQLSEDGNEMQYQVNYLSTFLLTRLLIKKLKASDQSRIISLSSLAHYNAGECDFSSVNDKDTYSPEENYCFSKAALVMMSHSLQQKLADFNIEVYAVHPGIVRTELYRQQGWLSALTNFGGKYTMKSPLEGALTVIRLALIPREEIQYNANSPIYYTDDLAMEPLVWSKDESKQSELWNETSKLLGLDASLEN